MLNENPYKLKNVNITIKNIQNESHYRSTCRGTRSEDG